MKKLKLFKQLAAVLLVVTMLCALTVSASAATTVNHKYNLYQIMSGTQDGMSSKLGDVEWGEGIDKDAFIEGLFKAGFIAKADKTAAAVAEKLALIGNKTEDANKLAKIAFQCKATVYKEYTEGSGELVLDPGYYLCEDVTVFKANETDTYYNFALLQVTNKDEFDLSSKVEVPAGMKYVKENSTEEWQIAADYNRGDYVPFKLECEVGSLLGFDSYKLIMHDLDANNAFDFTEDDLESVVVTCDGEPVDSAAYTVEIIGTNKIDFVFDDITEFAEEGSTIEVTFLAKLASNAAVGINGNINQLYLEYSNNPNDPDSTGKTPTQTVTVYTWQLAIEKVDQGNNPLAGAAFQLCDAEGNEIGAPVEAVKRGNKYIATFSGLDSDTYIIKESTTPDGYNTIDDVTCTIVASYSDATVADIEEVIAEPTDSFSVDGEYTVSTTIMNKMGVELPETGGIGTTIFYALGAAMLTLGVVLFITKKRVNEG